ncbi:MAG: cation:proton antiporter [Rhodococcus sp. (in: high G+C Gram-positive bacteria)]
MDISIVLGAVGLIGVVVASISNSMRRLPVSEPMLGLAGGVLLGPQVVGLLDIGTLAGSDTVLHESSNVLLAISVMGVALRYPVADARRQWRPVVLLLLVALPVMAVVTAAVSWWLLSIPIAAAALLGAALCPTDPVLASSVVTGPDAERDLPARSRQILSLESGANDGLALPLVIAAVALAGGMSVSDAALGSLWQILGATVVGAAMGALGGLALRWGESHGATDAAPALFFTVVLALGILGIADSIGTDGVLAVFVGGLLFNAVGTGAERTSEVQIDEAINRFAVLPLFVLLGAALPWNEWGELGWTGPAAVVMVLLVRRIPIVLALKRPLSLRLRDAMYLGWFGPVGVSALFYLTMEAEMVDEQSIVVVVGTQVLAASTVALGVTGVAGRLLYRRASARAVES